MSYSSSSTGEYYARRLLPSSAFPEAYTPPTWETSPDILYELSPAEKRTSRFAVEGNSIITGGCGHLGLEVARALLEHGAPGVSLFDVDPAKSHTFVNQLRLDFPSAKIMTQKVDICDELSVLRAVAETIAELGSVNILLCFAGVEACNHALLIGLEEWRSTLAENAKASWLCARVVARRMIQQGTGGSIVFTASISAHSINFPVPQLLDTRMGAVSPTLSQSKSSAAAEWARYGIRVNSISPGYMDTMYNENIGLEEARSIWASKKPMGMIGGPSELTGTVVLLCSRAGKYINGADILVDGGGNML
ncbi:NAD(P)-binding protein [Leucogyrophana mollusca]|uniref:NAD(P)-binding protein n=1 Tax=Leucogyrophana mollusca TaxID=85980 RepID=A0ACB8BCT3_9AGAM|nr:NAD(P)-binding protein [Leucogyrophana mollusca]